MLNFSIRIRATRKSNRPSSRSFRPRESRYSLELLPSQMRTSLLCRSLALVDPRMNHSSSSITPRKKTRLVVSKGSLPAKSQPVNQLTISVRYQELPFLRQNRNWAPKIDLVPVPVRSPFTFPESIIFRMRLRYCNSSWCFIKNRSH